MDAVKRHLTALLRVALGAVFLYAALIKIANPPAFAGNVAAYQLLPYAGNYLVAAILPWIEAICGLLLVTGWRARSAAALVAAMNMLFIVLLFSTVARGLDIDCGCFRQGGEKTTAWTAIFRDILLLVAAVFVFRKTKQ
ncbi:MULTISPECIES: MauE/DoxX family redox-associated membrane protein [Geobacter]|uniref:DoxX family protein n=2 Tax=Geobacter TaxID=28231 RepID=A0A0C1U016_9BACT|nr:MULTISPECIES: MauE/DoxX family redox-associated membrane protein [Geobacter]ANA39474.1 DoxX family protein [Geobacter anodireducens]KIE41205.1 DoxX family protein [Geobacter soli]MBE2886357.1 DoxX family membrane protein [Geobacter anodireducens]HMN01711.1 MauE/DoxX family redox-associated membrane protein [Geobacter anodireducens]